MVQNIVPAPDMFYSGIMAIAQQAVFHFLRLMHMEDKFKKEIHFTSCGTTFTQKAEEASNPSIIENQIVADVKFTTAPGGLKWPTAASAIDHQEAFTLGNIRQQLFPIFIDKDLGITVVEYNRPCGISITCTLTLTDLTDATDCINRIMTLASSKVVPFFADYDYMLPIDIYGAIYYLYKFADKDPDQFVEYLKTNSNGIIGKMVNRHDNTDVALAVRKAQNDMLLSIEVADGEPEPEGKGKSPDQFNVMVKLDTQINMINMLGLIHPIVVNNKLVPKNFIPMSNDVNTDPEYSAHPFVNVEEFRKMLLGKAVSYKATQYPWYDKWQPNLPSGYMLFLTNVFLLDDITNENGKTSISIVNDFSNIMPEIIKIMKEAGGEIFGFNSFFHVAIYFNNYMMEPSEFEFDPETLTITTGARNVNGVYRLVMAFNPNQFAKLREFRTLHGSLFPILT